MNPDPSFSFEKGEGRDGFETIISIFRKALVIKIERNIISAEPGSLQ
jgi:hypothetical protein